MIVVLSSLVILPIPLIAEKFLDDEHALHIAIHDDNTICNWSFLQKINSVLKNYFIFLKQNSTTVELETSAKK